MIPSVKRYSNTELQIVTHTKSRENVVLVGSTHSLGCHLELCVAITLY